MRYAWAISSAGTSLCFHFRYRSRELTYGDGVLPVSLSVLTDRLKGQIDAYAFDGINFT
jgi:hypothetical protein